VLIDWKQISYPYLDSETPVLDAVIQRAKMEGVRTVIVAGEIVYQDGKFTRLDRDAALAPTCRYPQATADRRGNGAPQAGESRVSVCEVVLRRL
jgi:hypothetical protein